MTCHDARLLRKLQCQGKTMESSSKFAATNLFSAALLIDISVDTHVNRFYFQMALGTPNFCI